jgi:hypothetical protein
MVLGTALPGGNPRKFLFLEPNPHLEGMIAQGSALIKAQHHSGRDLQALPGTVTQFLQEFPVVFAIDPEQ